VIARVSAIGALACAVVVIVLIVMGSGSQYTLRADFEDASGLVPGDQVLIGPANVGSIKSISLTPNGQAQVVMGLDSDASPMHQGTVARIYENSLSGIANKYVVLQPGPSNAAEIPSNGTLDTSHTRAEVNLDQLFDTLDAPTRAGLSNYIKGSATSIEGRANEANRTLKYFAPGLSSTSQVTAELVRNEPAFDGLLVQGARALQALDSRSQELSALIANTSTTTGAIASQSTALEQALSLLPGALTHTTSTYKGVQSTLDALDPLVAKSKPAVRRLPEFGNKLTTLTNVAIPTIGQLSALIHNPAGTGDLTQLALETPSLARIAAKAFPELVRQMNDSQNQLDYFREYTPDLVAAFTNLGQIGGYYDANGHYARTQPTFFSFDLNSANQLVERAPFQNSYNGLHMVHGRCPGGAVQPTPDASAPWNVPGCQPTATPPGP
jgi:phospholipid/cholesterol/gamma-HCH transport system substrate-binding protein